VYPGKKFDTFGKSLQRHTKAVIRQNVRTNGSAEIRQTAGISEKSRKHQPNGKKQQHNGQTTVETNKNQ
jgi:hypothetical protein